MTTMSGWKRAGLLDRLGDGAGLGDDLEAVAPVEEGDEALADDLVVVDDRAGGASSARGHAAVLSVTWMPPRGRAAVDDDTRAPPGLAVDRRASPPSAGARSRRFASPKWPLPQRVLGIEPDAVVVDAQQRRRPRRRHGATIACAGAAVAGDVAQRLARDLTSSWAASGVDAASSSTAPDEVERQVDAGPAEQLVGHRLDARRPRSASPALRAEPDDEVADVADRRVQAVDRPVDARRPPPPGRRSMRSATSSSDRLTA